VAEAWRIVTPWSCAIPAAAVFPGSGLRLRSGYAAKPESEALGIADASSAGVGTGSHDAAEPIAVPAILSAPVENSPPSAG
jgi:hypothetical protein